MPEPVEALGPLVSGVDRIVVLRANSIGDFVLALPALEALRAAYPHAETTYLGAPWHPELLDGRPGPWDRAMVVPAYPGILGKEQAGADTPGIRGFFATQRLERYDLAVQLHGGGANSNGFVAELGARVSIGLRDFGAPPLDRTLRYVYYQHEVHRLLEVVSLAGALPVSLDPRLAVTAGDRAAAREALSGIDRGLPLVVVHPGANDPRRRWPAENFAAIAQDLADRGACIAIVGHGADDEHEARDIAANMRASPLDLVGKLSLGALLGVLERARLVLANDSGPRHLAGAVGTATASVYWCGNLMNMGPLTRARHRVSVSFRTTCPVCGVDQDGYRCRHDRSFVADVAVDEVRRNALDLYEEQRLITGSA